MKRSSSLMQVRRRAPVSGALVVLLACSSQSVPETRSQAPTSEKTIGSQYLVNELERHAQLVQDLGSEDPQTRDRSFVKLEALFRRSGSVRDYLKHSMIEGQDPEVADRIRMLFNRYRWSDLDLNLADIDGFPICRPLRDGRLLIIQLYGLDQRKPPAFVFDPITFKSTALPPPPHGSGDRHLIAVEQHSGGIIWLTRRKAQERTRTQHWVCSRYNLERDTWSPIDSGILVTEGDTETTIGVAGDWVLLLANRKGAPKDGKDAKEADRSKAECFIVGGAGETWRHVALPCQLAELLDVGALTCLRIFPCENKFCVILGIIDPYAGPLQNPKELIALFSPQDSSWRIAETDPNVVGIWPTACTSMNKIIVGGGLAVRKDEKCSIERAPGVMEFDITRGIWTTLEEIPLNADPRLRMFMCGGSVWAYVGETEHGQPPAAIYDFNHALWRLVPKPPCGQFRLLGKTEEGIVIGAFDELTPDLFTISDYYYYNQVRAEWIRLKAPEEHRVIPLEYRWSLSSCREFRILFSQTKRGMLASVFTEPR